MHIELFSYQLDVSPLWAKDIVVALLGIALAVSLSLANKKGENILIQIAMIIPIAYAIHVLPQISYISISSVFDDIVIAIGIGLLIDYITTKKERPDLKYRFINIYVLLTLYAIIKYQSNVLKFTLNSLLLIPVLMILTLFPPVDIM